MTPRPDGVDPYPVVVRVHCRVDALADLDSLGGAVLRVSLEDVSLADAPAVVVAAEERSLRTPDDLLDPVELEATLSERRAYTVRAHVSRTGERQVQVDDFLSTASHPIQAVTGSVDVDVDLVRV